MRLVLDTNVVISALLWGGEPHKFIRAATEGDVILCTSQALLEELHDVLRRPHLAQRLASHFATSQQAVDRYGDLAIDALAPSAPARVVPGDADDDHVIAAAVAAKADLIVSGDRHLLTLGSHEGIAIVTVRQALARLGVV